MLRISTTKALRRDSFEFLVFSFELKELRILSAGKRRTSDTDFLATEFTPAYDVQGQAENTEVLTTDFADFCLLGFKGNVSGSAAVGTATSVVRGVDNSDGALAEEVSAGF